MVPLVEKINYRHHIHCRSVLVSGIYVIAKRDKTDIVSRKDVIDILSDLNIIAPETAQIFDDYKIDFSRFRVLKQPSNSRTIEIGTAKSVVNINIPDVPALLRDVLCKDQFLIFD